MREERKTPIKHKYELLRWKVSFPKLGLIHVQHNLLAKQGISLEKQKIVDENNIII